MAALTSENLRWANCSWVGGAKSREFLGESLLGIGLLMTGGFREGRLTLLERGDLVKGRSGKTSFSLAESWLSLLSRSRCSIVAEFGLTKTWRKTRPWHLSQSNWILHSSSHWGKDQFLYINSHFQNLNYRKNHNFKVSFFTKFTFSKSHFSQNPHFHSLIFHIFQTWNSW